MLNTIHDYKIYDKEILMVLKRDISVIYGLPGELSNLHNTDTELKNRLDIVQGDANTNGSIEKAKADALAYTDSKVKDLVDNHITPLENKMAIVQGDENTEGSIKKAKADAIAYTDTPSNNENPIIRLETLLWGGDELTFVAPAWLGFELLQNFYQTVEMKLKGEKQAFTHAAGIVFCHAKSPIRLMRQLANALADHNKNNYPDGREYNYWDYIILESTDYPSNNNIDDFFTQQYASLGIEKDRKPLRPAINWHKSKQTLNKLIQNEQLPKGQLYKILQQVDKTEAPTASWNDLNQTDYSPTTAQEKQEKRLLDISKGKLKNKLPKLAKNLFDLDINQPKQRLMFWVHLIETWDYLLPRCKKGDEQ